MKWKYICIYTRQQYWFAINYSMWFCKVGILEKVKVDVCWVTLITRKYIEIIDIYEQDNKNYYVPCIKI